VTSRDFCFWLQGYLELQATGTAEPPQLHPSQIACVRKHLALVFKHEVDPSMGGPDHQAELNELHHPGGRPPTAAPVMRC